MDLHQRHLPHHVSSPISLLVQPFSFLFINPVIMSCQEELAVHHSSCSPILSNGLSFQTSAATKHQLCSVAIGGALELHRAWLVV